MKIDENFAKWYEKYSRTGWQYQENNAGHVTYAAIDAHESVHVTQLESEVDKIEKHFKDAYSSEPCFDTPKKRDEAYDEMTKVYSSSKTYKPYFRSREGYEKSAYAAEWEVYKQLYEKYKSEKK